MHFQSSIVPHDVPCWRRSGAVEVVGPLATHSKDPYQLSKGP